MQPVIVSDTTCLILLQKIGELNLLQKLFDQILTTQIVADEFGAELPNWINVQNPIDRKNQMILETSLDKGEASAIALALEKENSLLIIDELKGRKFAKRLGLTITGTLGILAQAKKSGYIPLLKPLLDKVKETDFRLNDQLINDTLSQVGE